MDEDPHFVPPVNPLPPVVILLVLAMALIEGTISLAAEGFVGGQAGIGWRLVALNDYVISPPVWDYYISRSAIFDPDFVTRLFGYPFVHGSFTHALWAMVLLLAMGKFVGEAFGNIAVLVIFFGGAIFGAAVFCMIASDQSALFGGFPPVYALIGGYTYILWLKLGQARQNQLKAFRLIGFLLALQLIFGVLFGGGQGWIAELAAVIFGFAIGPALAPGGFGAMLARLRERH